MTNQDGDKSQGKAGGQRQGAEGQKGVPQETVGSGKKTDPNNFANDPQRAAEAGRKGGQSRGGDKG
jgi:general stress protein YciG